MFYSVLTSIEYGLFIVVDILYSHKRVKCEFICQSGRDGGFAVATFLLQKHKYTVFTFMFGGRSADKTVCQSNTFAHANFF